MGKNVLYALPNYIGNYIHIINGYIKISLLGSLWESSFTFFHDTQGVTSTERMAVYATFDHNIIIKVYFIEVYTVRKVEGMSL